MAAIAVLGYGTVGSGVIEVLRTNQESIDKRAGQPINVKYVLDLRDFPGDPVQEIITHDFEDILNDDEVKVVVEVMGGIEPAFTFVKKALLKGKSVCTSNKELVAKHGAELLAIAKSENINFLFEASVGGGIPIIRPLNQSLTADEIQEITGILNGTTNYMLTKMTKESLEYDDVLKEAQAKGYAERNPEADVEGHDTCRKIAILLSLALGNQVDYENIYTEGITRITKTDIDYVNKMGKSIKLLATAKVIRAKGVWARVCPTIIDDENPLSMVNDVFNAILVKGNVIGDVMFYGSGAGKLPTASAVVADVVDAIKHLERNIMTTWSTEKLSILDIDEIVVSKFVRVSYTDKAEAVKEIENSFGKVQFIEVDGLDDEMGFVTDSEQEAVINAKLNELINGVGVESVLNSIRMDD